MLTPGGTNQIVERVTFTAPCPHGVPDQPWTAEKTVTMINHASQLSTFHRVDCPCPPELDATPPSEPGSAL